MLEDTTAEVGTVAHSILKPTETPKRKEHLIGTEAVRELKNPVVVLVQTQNPRIFRELSNKNSVTRTELNTPLTWDVVQDLTRVYYEPYLLMPRKAANEKLDTFAKLGKVEEAGNFGPFSVYRFVREEEGGREMTFGSRKKASQAIAEILSDNVTYKQPEIDKKPKVPEGKERYFKGIKRSERQAIRQDLETLFEEKFVNRLTQTGLISEYPSRMLTGLTDIVDDLYASAPKDSEGRVVTNVKDINWLKWHFAEENIIPLKEYLELRIQSKGARKEGVFAEEVAEAVDDYDYAIDTMKAQADILIGEQEHPYHFGFLIPKGSIDGLKSGETSIEFTYTHLVINVGDGAWSYPLPEKTKGGEIAIKGGVARLVAKVALGLPIDDELPPSDIDLVTFGSDKAFNMEAIKAKYDVDARDVERVESGNINEFLGDRDQAVNEVLMTEKGLVMSLNALSTYFQRTTEASADPVRNIYGQHVLNINRGYLGEVVDAADYFLVNGTRFPTPRALSRMYKFLIEGKVDSITIPEGSLKMDIGSAHWLVLARKLVNEKDETRREKLLHRMVELANVVNSPYFKEEYLESKSGPFKFIESIAKEFEKETGRKFDMNGELSDKETLDWIAGRLVRQILTRFDRFFGYNRELAFGKRLTAKDMLPTQIVLPEDKHFSEEYWNMTADLEPKQEKVEEFNWREVDIDAILANPKYQELSKRHEVRDKLQFETRERSYDEWRTLMDKLRQEESEDIKATLTSWKENKEHQYFIKFKSLEKASKIALDPGMYPILQRFNRLPFSSSSSDTNHVIPGTDSLEEGWSPAALYFIADSVVSEEEKEIQWQFIRGIDRLNTKICWRLGIVPYNILSLSGEVIEFEDSHVEELSISETLENGMGLFLNMNIHDQRLRNEYGRAVLVVIWEEFYKYVNSFLGEEHPVPDFKGGDIFVRQDK